MQRLQSIWDISFFLFNPNPQFRNMEYARRKFYCRGWQKKKNVKMGRCNLKYNVLAEEVCHALHDVHLAARMPRAFLNFLSEYDERILLTFNATEHKIKAS